MNTIPFHQIQAIFFDLDGTLIEVDDSIIIQLENRLLPILGKRSLFFSRWILSHLEIPGNQLITFLDFLGLDKSLTRFTDTLRRYLGFYPPEAYHLIPGVSQLLLNLRGNYQVALVSTRSRYQIDLFLKKFPIETNFFETTCGLQDTTHHKPYPDPIQLTAKKIGVAVENCLMVGDSAVDIQSARSSGVWSIGVLCGVGKKNEFKHAGAHLVLNHTSDLSKYL